MLGAVHCYIEVPAPVAQRIEHWPPKPGAAVRVRPGAPLLNGALFP